MGGCGGWGWGLQAEEHSDHQYLILNSEGLHMASREWVGGWVGGGGCVSEQQPSKVGINTGGINVKQAEQP